MDALGTGRASPTTIEDSERGKATHLIDFRKLFDSEICHDVVLELEGAGGKSATLKAHKVVLVASSSYFASLFSTAWQGEGATESLVQTVRVQCEEEVEHMRLFFGFLYGEEVQLDLACAHPLLRLGDFYGVDALMTQCLQFLERVLHPQPTRCFTLFEGSCGRPPPPPQERLIALCTEVLARSFSEACAHAAFRRCPAELLAAVLERDDLSVDRESSVLSALQSWAEHDWPQRESMLMRLLPLVRWPLIDGVLLADVEEAYPLFSDPATPCAAALKQLLLDALKFQAASDQKRARLIEMATGDTDAERRLRPRTPNMVRLQGEGKFCWRCAPPRNARAVRAQACIPPPPLECPKHKRAPFRAPPVHACGRTHVIPSHPIRNPPARPSLVCLCPLPYPRPAHAPPTPSPTPLPMPRPLLRPHPCPCPAHAPPPHPPAHLAAPMATQSAQLLAALGRRAHLLAPVRLLGDRLHAPLLPARQPAARVRLALCLDRRQDEAAGRLAARHPLLSLGDGPEREPLLRHQVDPRRVDDPGARLGLHRGAPCQRGGAQPPRRRTHVHTHVACTCALRPACACVSSHPPSLIPARRHEHVHTLVHLCLCHVHACARVPPPTHHLSFRLPRCRTCGRPQLLPLATLHSPNHGYILEDALQFTIQFERVSEGASGSGRAGQASASSMGGYMQLGLASALASESLGVPLAR